MVVPFFKPRFLRPVSPDGFACRVFRLYARFFSHVDRGGMALMTRGFFLSSIHVINSTEVVSPLLTPKGHHYGADVRSSKPLKRNGRPNGNKVGLFRIKEDSAYAQILLFGDVSLILRGEFIWAMFGCMRLAMWWPGIQDDAGLSCVASDGMGCVWSACRKCCY